MAAIVRYEAGGRRNDDNFVSEFIDRRVDVRKNYDNKNQPWIVRRV
jgi:hypothetical protein